MKTLSFYQKSALWTLIMFAFIFAVSLLGDPSKPNRNFTLDFDHVWKTNDLPGGFVLYEEVAGQFVPVGTTAATNRSMTITNVAPGAHSYVLTATNIWWESRPSTSVSTPQGLNTPTLLRITVTLTNSP